MGRLLGLKERHLFDSINAEVYSLAAAEDVIVWKWYKSSGAASVSGSLDLLYGEPILGSRHYIPFKTIAYFERPSNNIETPDEGSQYVRESRVFISRLICERSKIPADTEGYHVRVGDIFEFFRKGRTFYLEARNVEKDGWINDQQLWTQYLIDAVYNSTFTPDRKLIGSTNG